MDTLLAMAIDLAVQLQADPRCEAVRAAAAAADSLCILLLAVGGIFDDKAFGRADALIVCGRETVNLRACSVADRNDAAVLEHRNSFKLADLVCFNVVVPENLAVLAVLNDDAAEAA